MTDNAHSPAERRTPLHPDVNDTGIRLRLAQDDDRTYLSRLFYLTDVLGDETAALGEEHLRDIGPYVGEWSPRVDGGVIAISEYEVPAGGAWLRYFTGEHKGVAYTGRSDADPHDDSQWATEFDPEDIPELCIAVERRYAGLGLGKRLLRNVCDLAREQTAPAVSLWVDPRNERARRLYDAAGFTPLEVPGGEPGTMIYYF